ncbi:MAG TPA: hypothetical protein VMT21_03680 [Gemmatimonadales bacterium]|nr:hypothetical protein [Gemmatimonadales bacterium]
MSLGFMAVACTRPPAPPAPSGAWEPVGEQAFAAMAARSVPPAPQLIRVRWRYDDGNREATGRGAVRLAPPDSVRLDVAVPVVGRATLVLAGGSSWAQPDEVVDAVPRSRALLWALFGMIQPPDAGTRIEAGAAADRRLYRLTAPNGGVTVLECRGDTLLGATELKSDRVVGRLDLTRDATGAVVKADAKDFEHRARFIVEVEHREASEPFPAEIWRRP